MATYNEIQDLINEKLASFSKIPASYHREVEFALLNYINDNLPKRGDIKHIFVTEEEFGEQFDNTGLGIGIRQGWALINGNNGTPANAEGSFFLNFGGEYTALNAYGGERFHTLEVWELPPHDHLLPSDGAGAGERQSLIGTTNSNEALDPNEKTGVTGQGFPHNNMPPYIVFPAIMKL